MVLFSLTISCLFFFSIYCNKSISNAYIIAECDQGMANRLRSVVAHMYASKYLHNNEKLMMVWDVNDACPGHFLQLFRPLERVVFITNSSKEYFKANATKVYPNYCMALRQFCGIHNLKYRWRDEIQLWSQFKPIPDIDRQVHEYCQKNNVCNMTAMHIRKTDLERELKPKKRSRIQMFYRFIDIQPVNESIFLLTDDPLTQKHMQEKYGSSKIKVFRNMSSEYLRSVFDTEKLSVAIKNHSSPINFMRNILGSSNTISVNSISTTNVNIELNISNSSIHTDNSTRNSSIINTDNVSSNINITDNNSNSSISSSSSSSSNSLNIVFNEQPLFSHNHRFSSLEHTLIDVMIAARAKKFRPCAFSSLSELITVMRHIYKWDYCGFW